MLKKSLFLVFALLVVGLTVVQAQDEAKLERLGQELEQIIQRAETSGWTPQMTQRMLEIQQEMIEASGPYGSFMQPTQPTQKTQQQFPQQPQQQQQAQQNNWPTASTLNRYGLSSLRQPAGTVSQYEGSDLNLEIILTGSNANTIFQNMKQQIDTAVRSQKDVKQTNEDARFHVNYQDPNPNNSGGNRISINLFLQSNGIQLEIGSYHSGF